MGGGPHKEHLLILSPAPRDEKVIGEIEKKFTDVEVTYVHTEGGTGGGNPPKKDPEAGKGLRERLKPLFKKATLLATLGLLPDEPEDAPNLKLIHLFSAGIDHFLHHPLFTSTSIPITTSSGIHGPPICEWILSSVLASSKHFATTYENQKRHHWGSMTHRAIYASETDWVGKRVGIAGYGSIGRQVARVFVAMGSDVLAYTAGARRTAEERKDQGYVVPGTGDPEGVWPKAWYSGTSKDALYTFLRAELDALIVCLPLTDGTRGLLGREEFEVLKEGNHGKGTYLVNISRGGILRQEELVECLNDGTLSGAALDVTEPEPLPEGDGLWDAKNVIISPHVSALGREYMGRAYDVLMVNLGRLERGKKLVNEVQRKKGY